MTNENKLVPVVPKTYEVRYLENQNQEVKKSPLSVAAKAKVVQRHGGSNYQSERLNEINPGYGPMPNGHGCPQRTGYEVNVSLTGEYSFKQGGGRFTSCKITGEIMDLSNIRNWLRNLEDGIIIVVRGSGSCEDRDSDCRLHERRVKSRLREIISTLEGSPVYGFSKLFYV